MERLDKLLTCERVLDGPRATPDSAPAAWHARNFVPHMAAHHAIVSRPGGQPCPSPRGPGVLVSD